MYGFAVRDLELGGELPDSGHVVGLYQLLPGLLVSDLQPQTKRVCVWGGGFWSFRGVFPKRCRLILLTCSTEGVVHSMPTWQQ